MKHLIVLLVAGLLTFLTSCKNSPSQPPPDAGTTAGTPGYELVWSDEFNGSSLDLTKWNYETGTGVNGDFGTGQIDRATNRVQNVSIEQGIAGAESGCLAIVTRKEFYIDRNYTSGRVTSSGKGAWGPGYRIEARVKPVGVLYKGQGFAFWMMPAEKPADQASLMWPQGGEIDIMEYVGSIPYHNLGSVHYAWNWLNNQWSAGNHAHKGAYYSYYSKDVPVSSPTYGGFPPDVNEPAAGSFAFHTYGIDWYGDRMEFFVDSTVYHVHYFKDGAAFDNGVADGQDKEGIKTINGKRTLLSEYSNHFTEWNPFEHQFFIILSAGVGGNDAVTYGGAIVPEAVFPCAVYIDWVRVYRRT